jgi:PIN domain nuclease of toxin-antitoxin system
LKLLLDTHAVLWWFNGNPALSRSARAAIANEEAEVFVSAASAMEITTKHRLGKLPEADGLVARFEAMMAHQRFAPLEIRFAHGLLAGRLDIPHKDPFDRLLIAQSLIERIPLVSNEAIFDRAGVSRIW